MSFSIQATTLGPGEGRVIQVPGHPITYKATTENTGGAYSLLEVARHLNYPPFASLSDMASIAYPYLPLKRLLGNRYNSVDRISQLHLPVLIFHGDQDEIVPLSQGHKLLEAANSPKSFQVLPGAGHNDTYYAAGDIYWQALSEFLGSLAAPPSR